MHAYMDGWMVGPHNIAWHIDPGQSQAEFTGAAPPDWMRFLTLQHIYHPVTVLQEARGCPY